MIWVSVVNNMSNEIEKEKREVEKILGAVKESISRNRKRLAVLGVVLNNGGQEKGESDERDEGG